MNREKIPEASFASISSWIVRRGDFEIEACRIFKSDKTILLNLTGREITGLGNELID